MPLEREITASYASSAAVPPHARLVLRMLQKLRHGSLRISCPDGTMLAFGSDGAPVLLQLDSWEPFAAALKSGDIGFAESYIAGQWHTDDLAGLLQLEPGHALTMVLVVFGFGQLLESFVLTPRLVGERIGLHPLHVIFALMAFGQLFGFVGVLVALPVSAVLLVAIRRLRAQYQASALYRGV